MTKMKTASGKEKRSTREVSNGLKTICFPCLLGSSVSLAPGVGETRDTGSKVAFRVHQ